MDKSTCNAQGCARVRHARGWCSMHYKRWAANGTTELPTVEGRFWAKVDVSQPLGCWEWTAAKHPLGYGNFRVSTDQYMAAHRFAYELLMGKPPEGLVLDHLCRNSSCVNPDHLEPVTQQENTLRGAGWAGRNKCPRGHRIGRDGDVVVRDGVRRCRGCLAVAA